MGSNFKPDRYTQKKAPVTLYLPRKFDTGPQESDNAVIGPILTGMHGGVA
jgi:hypothetical protein